MIISLRREIFAGITDYLASEAETRFIRLANLDNITAFYINHPFTLDAEFSRYWVKVVNIVRFLRVLLRNGAGINTVALRELTEYNIRLNDNMNELVFDLDDLIDLWDQNLPIGSIGKIYEF